MGYKGGEGGQWPRSLAVDSTGEFLVIGIDVGGIYRSLDGGMKWEPANVGYTPRGSACVAIDPRNSNRVLSIAANSAPLDRHGIYLSENRAASWRSVLPLDMGGDEFRDQIVYDPTSYDSTSEETKRIFWSRIKKDHATWGNPKSDPNLYVSNDAGRTWAVVPNQQELAGQILRFHPRGEYLYAAGENGLWRINPKSFSKEKVVSSAVTGVDVCPSNPDWVWVSQPDALRVSRDSGRTWTALRSNGLVRPNATLRWIKVSPADPMFLSVWSDEAPNGYNWPRYVSQDGGRSWTESKKDSTGAFLPDNSRNGLTIWHPKKSSVAWSLGGDWPTKSNDGGRTFRYSAQGINAVLVGGHFNFSQGDPNVIFFGSQDYNGAVSTDGGATWRYLEISGNGWGGFCYGGYAINKKTFFVGNAAGWGAPRILRVSNDGGKTWQEKPVTNKGLDSSRGWNRNPDVAFFGNWRTKDAGSSWKEMPLCDGVLAETPEGNLFGVKKGSPWRLVSSTNGGESWKDMGPLPGEVFDLAWDPKDKRLLGAIELALWTYKGGKWALVDIPKDQYQSTRVRSVAVDPKVPDVIYVGSAANIYTSNTSMLRSLDGGKSWQNLTQQTPLDGTTLDGGREAYVVRVHPRTSRVYVSTSCFGIWTYPPAPDLIKNKQK